VTGESTKRRRLSELIDEFYDSITFTLDETAPLVGWRSLRT